MDNEVNNKIAKIFNEVGEFGPYQLLIILLGGGVSIFQAIDAYSFVFTTAIPNFRYFVYKKNNS